MTNEKSHVYVSTACLHGLHVKCRETCKYCGTKCSCSGCDHTGLEASPQQRIQAVLDYVAKLECTNCEHVHEEGWCDFAYDGGVCRCGWGPPQVAVDIRDLLKEQP